MSDSDFLKGLIIGGLIGAVAGLLLAPKSGKETRADIYNKSEELMKMAKDEYDKGVQKTSEVFHSVKDAAVSGIQGESGRLTQAVQAGVKAYNEAKKE